MKSAWGPDLCDMAAWNTERVEGVEDIFDFNLDSEEMLAEDVDCAEWARMDDVEPDTVYEVEYVV